MEDLLVSCLRSDREEPQQLTLLLWLLMILEQEVQFSVSHLRLFVRQRESRPADVLSVSYQRGVSRSAGLRRDLDLSSVYHSSISMAPFRRLTVHLMMCRQRGEARWRRVPEQVNSDTFPEARSHHRRAGVMKKDKAEKRLWANWGLCSSLPGCLSDKLCVCSPWWSYVFVVICGRCGWTSRWTGLWVKDDEIGERDGWPQIRVEAAASEQPGAARE
ncbi:unnamed protein product [Pleuronectes platessa]|uniref:Uncharacterized protein n=1 Tax=Pleuronectes platessa TaxID=8262 RepID=A0A9N7ZD74_PLEPL|nr:unnamed protein product [Pleuronectes platessa]